MSEYMQLRQQYWLWETRASHSGWAHWVAAGSASASTWETRASTAATTAGSSRALAAGFRGAPGQREVEREVERELGVFTMVL